MFVEVIVSQIRVVFETQCILGYAFPHIPWTQRLWLVIKNSEALYTVWKNVVLLVYHKITKYCWMRELYSDQKRDIINTEMSAFIRVSRVNTSHETQTLFLR